MDELKNTIRAFDESAHKYQEKFMDVTLYAESLIEFCQLLPKNAEVLELGCGPGNITKFILDRRDDLEVLATDMAPEMLKLAAINCSLANYRLMDSREIFTLEEKYDAIVCGFIFPYLTKGELANFVKDAAERLNENGIIYISTMIKEEGGGVFISTSSDGQYTLPINYHDRNYLKENLFENGFTVLHENIVQQNESADLDLILIARLREY